MYVGACLLNALIHCAVHVRTLHCTVHVRTLHCTVHTRTLHCTVHTTYMCTYMYHKLQLETEHSKNTCQTGKDVTLTWNNFFAFSPGYMRMATLIFIVTYLRLTLIIIQLSPSCTGRLGSSKAQLCQRLQITSWDILQLTPPRPLHFFFYLFITAEGKSPEPLSDLGYARFGNCLFLHYETIATRKVSHWIGFFFSFFSFFRILNGTLSLFPGTLGSKLAAGH